MYNCNDEATMMNEDVVPPSSVGPFARSVHIAHSAAKREIISSSRQSLRVGPGGFNENLFTLQFFLFGRFIR